MGYMTGAQAAITQLVAEGVTHILSIPGEHNIALCDAILDHPGLTYVTGRHEQGSTLMADGYSRASNRIAVPLLISGPGVTNALTALGDAFQDSVPMVTIVAQAHQNQIGRGSFHGLKDQSGAIAAVTKWNTCVRSVAEIPEAIRTAFVEAYRGRPGPTVVEIPLDIQTEQGDVEIYPSTPPALVKADQTAISQAAHRLATAQNPVIYAGRGTVISGACEQLQCLIEHLNAPCFLTALGKGILATDHPLNISWGNGRSQHISQLIADADVVLVVGSSLDYADAGRLKLAFPEALIQIDTCPEILGRMYPLEIGICGDAKSVLEQLFIELKQCLPSPRTVTSPQIIGQADQPKMTMLAYRNYQLKTKFKSTSAWQYIHAIQQAITDDTLVFGDPARCNGWGVAFLDRNLPNTYHCSRNFCTLGYAVSAAMGAKLAQPDRPILAMIGDGGLLFANGDLATAVQYSLNIVIVVFNDNCYGSIRKAQRQAFDRTIGIDLQNPDFCQLAQAFGIAATRVDQPKQLTAALTQAWKNESPYLIEIAMTPNDPGFEI
jgi:acetolactate synthase-1/2/3 large subunit